MHLAKVKRDAAHLLFSKQASHADCTRGPNLPNLTLCMTSRNVTDKQVQTHSVYDACTSDCVMLHMDHSIGHHTLQTLLIHLLTIFSASSYILLIYRSNTYACEYVRMLCYENFVQDDFVSLPYTVVPQYPSHFVKCRYFIMFFAMTGTGNYLFFWNQSESLNYSCLGRSKWQRTL